MKKQMAKIIAYGTYRVIYDDEKKINPYRITKDGKKEIDYADFYSCLHYLAGKAVVVDAVERLRKEQTK